MKLKPIKPDPVTQAKLDQAQQMFRKLRSEARVERVMRKLLAGLMSDDPEEFARGVCCVKSVINRLGPFGATLYDVVEEVLSQHGLDPDIACFFVCSLMAQDEGTLVPVGDQ